MLNMNFPWKTTNRMYPADAFVAANNTNIISKQHQTMAAPFTINPLLLTPGIYHGAVYESYYAMLAYPSYTSGTVPIVAPPATRPLFYTAQKHPPTVPLQSEPTTLREEARKRKWESSTKNLEMTLSAMKAENRLLLQQLRESISGCESQIGRRQPIMMQKPTELEDKTHQEPQANFQVANAPTTKKRKTVDDHGHRCRQSHGGPRCQRVGCDKGERDSAQSRCRHDGCDKSTRGYIPFCSVHQQDGRYCQLVGCEKVAQGSTPFCVAHEWRLTL
jgi:hypothetical protein